MSTLTKISVVVLVVLVLFASGPFIQQAFVPTSWKQAYKAEKARRELAEVSAQNYMLSLQVLQRLYEDAQGKADKKKEELLSKISDRNIEISRLTGLLAERSADMKELTASLAVAEQNLSGQINLNRALSGQLKGEQDKNIELSDQLRRAQVSVKENAANVEILIKARTVLEEQVAQKEAEIVKLREQLEAGGGVRAGVGEPVQVAPVKIEATVTAVKGDAASLNIGSASGVKKDMVFIIYRGADFVAHLRIADVGVSNSAGIITDRTREPKAGDKAATSLE